MATRRTHVVRIYDSSSGTKDKSSFVDVEVLDAVAFRIANNNEVILNMPSASAAVWRVDDIGTDSAQESADATRRTHMAKIESDDKTQFFAAEVFDVGAFRDANDSEWILDMPDDNASIYDATDSTGNDAATRRSHDEKISSTPGEKNPTSYMLVQRDDMVAFRRYNLNETIISMPSFDDGNGPRADTYITPQGYDGTDSGATPPDIDTLQEPHVYFKFMKDSAGIMTGDTKVRMGPFWWLRRVSSGAWLVIEIDFTSTNTPISPQIAFDDIGISSTSTTAVGLKQMPFIAPPGTGTPKYDMDYLKTTPVYAGAVGSGGIAGGTGSAKQLYFIYVPDARKNAGGGDATISIPIKIAGLPAQPNPTGAITRYYIWPNPANGSDPYSYGYKLPLPTVETAFLQYWSPAFPENPGLAGDGIHSGYYQPFNPYISYLAWNVGAQTPSGVPQSDGGIYGGWIKEADAQTATGGSSGLQVFSLTFPGTGPALPASFECTIKAGYYTDRTNFPYDDNDNPEYPKPSTNNSDAPKNYAEKSYSEGDGGAGTTITVTLSGDGEVKVA